MRILGTFSRCICRYELRKQVNRYKETTEMETGIGAIRGPCLPVHAV